MIYETVQIIEYVFVVELSQLKKVWFIRNIPQKLIIVLHEKREIIYSM